MKEVSLLDLSLKRFLYLTICFSSTSTTSSIAEYISSEVTSARSILFGRFTVTSIVWSSFTTLKVTVILMSSGKSFSSLPSFAVILSFKASVTVVFFPVNE